MRCVLTHLHRYSPQYAFSIMCLAKWADVTIDSSVFDDANYVRFTAKLYDIAESNEVLMVAIDITEGLWENVKSWSWNILVLIQNATILTGNSWGYNLERVRSMENAPDGHRRVLSFNHCNILFVAMWNQKSGTTIFSGRQPEKAEIGLVYRRSVDLGALWIERTPEEMFHWWWELGQNSCVW